MTAADEPLEIQPATAADDAARDAFVERHPESTFFHLAGWRRFVTRVHGHEARELLARRDGEIVGLLPAMLCRGPFGRRKLLSIPYAVYGGPLGADPGVVAALIDEACRVAESLRVRCLELRCRTDCAPGLAGTNLYSTFVRELPEDPADVLARMPKKARAEARRARKRHGLDLGTGVWYLDDLCRLFLLNKHALGSPALPPEHFRALMEEFDDRAFVHVVRHERKPVAAVLSLAFRDTLIAYYAGTAPGADRAVSASNFMYMALQEWAVERGYRVFDFCRSRVDSGAYRFKRHQGFEPTPLHYRFHLVGARSIPSFTPSNPKTAILRRTWAGLPLWVARRLSARLARYLP